MCYIGSAYYVLIVNLRYNEIKIINTKIPTTSLLFNIFIY